MKTLREQNRVMGRQDNAVRIEMKKKQTKEQNSDLKRY